MEDLIGKQISEAVARGEFDNLPGTGKPFNFSTDQYVPATNRLANRIMKDNDVLPDWIALSKLIEGELHRAHQRLQRAARHYKAAQATLAGRKDITSIRHWFDAQDNWKLAQDNFRDELALINKKVVNLNLMVPSSHLTRNLYDAEQELARYH